MEKLLDKNEPMTTRQTRKLRNRHNVLIMRCGIKTRALWIASEIIQEKIEPTKTVDQVYEMLKFLGKEKLKQDKPEVAKYVK